MIGNIFILEKCKDNLYEIFSHTRIIDLIKFRCVSKYLRSNVNTYIKRNKKKCDMMAYSCKFLLTPEYVVIKYFPVHKYNINNIVVGDHIINYSSTIRLIYYLDSNLKLTHSMPKLNMCKLKYIISIPNFRIENIPKIKFYYNYKLDLSKYNIRIVYLDLNESNNVNKINTFNYNVEIAMLKKTIHNLETISNFPNLRKIYIENYTYNINNLIYPNIEKIYIMQCFTGSNISEIFPNLRKVYIDLITYLICINGISICMRNDLTKYHKNMVKINHNEYNISNINCIYKNVSTINLTNFNSDINLLQIFPDLDTIIINGIFKCKLGNIIVKSIIYEEAIKKLAFSS